MNRGKVVRLGILHIHVITGDMHNNHRILGEAISIAAGYDCSAVFTGELIECGSYFWRNIELGSIPVGIYPYLNHLQEIAYKYKMHIFFGRAEQGFESGEIYSCYTHINQEGEQSINCHKQITEGLEERNYLSTGSQLYFTQMDELKIGLFIGYNEEIRKLMKYSKTAGADLIICAVSPSYHFNLREEVHNFPQVLQPVIFCNYDLSAGEQLYIGESIYFGSGKGSVLRPQHSSVIVVDFDTRSGSFNLVRCININEMLR